MKKTFLIISAFSISLIIGCANPTNEPSDKIAVGDSVNVKQIAVGDSHNVKQIAVGDSHNVSKRIAVGDSIAK